MKTILTFLILAVSIAFPRFSPGLYAQTPGPAPRTEPPGGAPASNADMARGGRYTVKLAVIGPGDELYFWWGHIGLVITDTVSGEERFYDWGLFSFERENFFVNFAFGRLIYSCGASPAERNIRIYTLTNRNITLYTLDLPPEKKDELRRFAEWNIQSENRDYSYHHFKDNCATRVRDILDTATYGQFKEAFGQAPGRFTLRQHVRRHTWFSPFFDWLLNFLMGQNIDTPITIWEEMFLPSEIALRASDFRYTDSTGIQRNLVSSVETLNRSRGRPIVLEKPRRQWPAELALGTAILGSLALFMLVRQKKPAAGRMLLGISQSLLGLFFGLTGSVLFFMTFFTNHDYTWHNSNILFINPLVLAVVPLGLMSFREKDLKKRYRREIILKSLWTYIAIGSILSLLIRVFPQFYQQNQVTVALVLPFALGGSFAPDWIAHIVRIAGGKKR
ncbi:MAG: DUF4105 domain-containing protein [Treponema sp.]|nr:DUF4105 domain-containing protein [Treponema sp.]